MLADKVRSFGATIQELSPLSFVAVFGLEPVEGASERAALAAIALRTTAERGQRVDARAPAVRVAVHVGHLLVGRFAGVEEIELEGKREAWRVLAELGARAESGSVLVSEAAASLLERRFELVPADAGDPSGPRRLVQRERTGFGLGGRPLSRFVGRGHELDTLTGLLAQAERGRGQVVTIVGEPGVGKSRLLYELTRSERLRGWRILGCGGVSHGLATPYLPLVELLRRCFGVEEADTPAEIGERIERTLRGLDPAAAVTPAGPPRPLRGAARRPSLACPRAGPASSGDAGGHPAPAAARESGPAAPRPGRGPSLDRFRDPGDARPAGRDPAHGPPPVHRHASSGVPARLGRQDLSQPASARPPERRSTPRPCSGPCWAREPSSSRSRNG